MNCVATLLPVSKLNNALKQISVSLVKSLFHRNSNSLLFIYKGHRHIFPPIKVAHRTLNALKYASAHILQVSSHAHLQNFTCAPFFFSH